MGEERVEKEEGKKEVITLHLGISSNYQGRHIPLLDFDSIRLPHLLRTIDKVNEVYPHEDILLIQSSIGRWHGIVLGLYTFWGAMELLHIYLVYGVQHDGHYFHSLRKGYIVLRLDNKRGWTPKPLYIYPCTYEYDEDILNHVYRHLYFGRWVSTRAQFLGDKNE